MSAADQCVDNLGACLRIAVQHGFNSDFVTAGFYLALADVEVRRLYGLDRQAEYRSRTLWGASSALVRSLQAERVKS